MNARQLDALTMRIVTVNRLETTPQSILVQMPQVEAVTAALKTKTETLRRFKNGQVLNRTGSRDAKEVLRTEMMQKGFETAASVRSYAIAIGNRELQMEVTYVYSDLERMRETDVADACQSIHDIAESNIDELADYGVNENSQTKLKDSIILFNVALPETRAGIVDQSTFTARIEQLFGETDVLLFQLDNLATMLRFREPVFYADYFSSRKIVNTGSRKLSLRGVITDEQGLPIDKVLITIENPNEDMAVSTAKGNYQFKGVEGGFWPVTFQRDGFVTEKVFLAITPNLRIDFSVTLKRIIEQERSA
jgi:hypothetical protein